MVASPIEATRKNENVSHLNARRCCILALFRFPRFLLRPGRSDRLQANSSTHPRRRGVVLSDLRPWSPWDHPIFLKFWVSDIEIDPKIIYVHISRPHPDRHPPELVKNHQKSRKFQRFRYFSNLSRHGFSRNVTEQSTMRKISIFFLVISIGHPTTRIWSWIHSGWWNQMSEFFKICNEKMSRHVK